MRERERERETEYYVHLDGESSNCLKRPKNVVRHSADVRVTSDNCRVTVQRQFSGKFSNCLNCLKNIVWQSAEGRVTSDQWSRDRSRDCRPKCSKHIAMQRPYNVIRQSADESRDLRQLSRDRSATFFKIFPNCLRRPENVVRESADGRVTLRQLSRDRSANFFKKFSNCLKRPKNVVRQSADVRVTSDNCRVTVQRLFSKHFPKLLESSKKRCLTVGRRSRDFRPLSRDRSATSFEKFPKIAWNVQKTLLDSQPTVAWLPTTVAWPFSDFFQNFPKLLETSKKRC